MAQGSGTVGLERVVEFLVFLLAVGCYVVAKW